MQSSAATNTFEYAVLMGEETRGLSARLLLLGTTDQETPRNQKSITKKSPEAQPEILKFIFLFHCLPTEAKYYSIPSAENNESMLNEEWGWYAVAVYAPATLPRTGAWATAVICSCEALTCSCNPSMATAPSLALLAIHPKLSAAMA